MLNDLMALALVTNVVVRRNMVARVIMKFFLRKYGKYYYSSGYTALAFFF